LPAFRSKRPENAILFSPEQARDIIARKTKRFQLPVKALIPCRIARHNHLASDLVKSIGKQLVQDFLRHPVRGQACAAEFHCLGTRVPTVKHKSRHKQPVIVDNTYRLTWAKPVRAPGNKASNKTLHRIRMAEQEPHTTIAPVSYCTSKLISSASGLGVIPLVICT
jgi:hypothetical protein